MNDKQRIDGLDQAVRADGCSIGIHPPGAHSGSPSRWMVAITDPGNPKTWHEFLHLELRGAIDAALAHILPEHRS